MSEPAAYCPNCGQPDFGSDQQTYMVIENQVYREFRCRVCHAYVEVRARITTVELPN